MKSFGALLHGIQYEKRQKQQYEIQYECPTIVINAGSHSIGTGNNAFQTGDQSLLDSNIIDQTQQTIANLLKQAKQNKIQLVLNQQNIMNKIHINDISIQKSAVYPMKADHIIDTQCSGAKSMIKSKYLRPQGKAHQQQDLLFLYKPNNIKELKFWQSSIIKNLQSKQKILNFFKTGHNKSKIKSVFQIFKASDYGFELKYFWKTQQTQYLNNNLLFICITNRNKIIGAYSPLSHLQKGKSYKPFFSSQIDKVVEDKSKTSFIFSLTENDKFELKDQSAALCHYKDTSEIRFGKNELIIGDVSNTKYCQANINTIFQEKAYFNPNFQKLGYKQSNRRFNGSDRHFFTTKQWQVWKIEMEK